MTDCNLRPSKVNFPEMFNRPASNTIKAYLDITNGYKT